MSGRKSGKTEREHWAYQFGSDQQFLNWLSYRPSCIDGDFSQWPDDGEPRNIACHYRSVACGAGTGRKPPFSAVPMTHRQHMLQEAKGYEVFHPREWWEAKVREYLLAWAESVAKTAAQREVLAAARTGE